MSSVQVSLSRVPVSRYLNPSFYHRDLKARFCTVRAAQGFQTLENIDTEAPCLPNNSH